MYIPFHNDTCSRVRKLLEDLRAQLRSENQMEKAENAGIAIDSLEDIAKKPSDRAIERYDAGYILQLADSICPFHTTPEDLEFQAFFDHPDFSVLAKDLNLVDNRENKGLAERIRTTVMLAVLGVVGNALREVDSEDPNETRAAEKLLDELNSLTPRVNEATANQTAEFVLPIVLSVVERARPILVKSSDVTPLRVCDSFVGHFADGLVPDNPVREAEQGE